MEWDLTELTEQARRAARELCEVAALRPGDLLVVGCSSSEVTGHAIGSFSSTQVADALFEGIFPVLSKQGVYLAAQCCEHLNRALIVEEEAARAHRLEVVNAVPQPKAGGAFATAAYREFSRPVAVERVRAQAGMDIGDTLIGMHLQPVAVPVRLSLRAIGQANLVCARTRPRYIGGERAHYDPALG
ncbi:TIGR01440 family protein [Bittarella massiliensis (ex Durand et al. 2017)]|uniref:TIGR01440 family protein n=1 Tax=Bittarella massiliensis (ex Durand et al. 2017) TaxID=1720313 RepID=UPI00073F0AB2|nr:TIGR01440 family protein [Bittarella massiliensis (ex Durand et al. 2017)]